MTACPRYDGRFAAWELPQKPSKFCGLQRAADADSQIAGSVYAITKPARSPLIRWERWRISAAISRAPIAITQIRRTLSGTIIDIRSEESRVGKEGVVTCRFRGSPDRYTKKP